MNKINSKIKLLKKNCLKLCILLDLKNVTITIKREKLEEHEGGYVTKKGENNYLIVINKSNKDSLETLCHEMVHIQQLETGRLSYKTSQISVPQKLWNGEVVPRETPYRQLPWEMEAFKLQNVLKKQL